MNKPKPAKRQREQPQITSRSPAIVATLVENARKRLVALHADPKNVSLLSQDTVLSEVKEFIPTGFHELDRILGGGWGVGRASEVYGAEGNGKSALSHRSIRAVQEQGGQAIVIDSENSLDPAKIRQLGISPSGLVYVTPTCIEETWDVIWSMIATLKKSPPDGPTLIVWDSIAGSVPRAELEEKSADSAHMGLVARALAKGCRRMYRAIAEVRAHMMWINQERANIGGGPWAEPETVGGKSVRYAASQRVRCTRVQTLKQGERSTGYRIKCVTKKNRLAPPQAKATWILDFKHGPSPELTLFEFLLENRQLRKTPAGIKAKFAEESFKRSAWFEKLRDPEFQRAANEAAVAILDGALTKANEAAETASEDEAGEE